MKVFKYLIATAVVLGLSSVSIAGTYGSTNGNNQTNGNQMNGSSNSMNDSRDTMKNNMMRNGMMKKNGMMKRDMHQMPNIVQKAATAAKFSMLVKAIKSGGLVEKLSSKGPFTVFAPTNEAFDKLPRPNLSALMEERNKGKLVAVLKAHVVSKLLTPAMLKEKSSLETVGGEELTVTHKNGKTMINGAEIVGGPIMTSNGVIYVINKVLMPKQ